VKLREGDFVVGAVKVEDDKQLITITEQGFGKRTSFEEYRVKGRGGLGVTCHNLTDKTGLLAGIAAVDDGDDLMMITNMGTIIRTPVKDINTYSRAASGVIVMRLSDGQSIVNFSKVAHEEVTEAENATAPEGENNAPAAENAAPVTENTAPVTEETTPNE
jgi:DNA gyrase subunit A